jgi:hypothetical protein
MFDEWLVNKLVRELGFDKWSALEFLLQSESRVLLEDYETGLWGESPLLMFDLVKTEFETGSPYKSTYLIGDGAYAGTSS